MLSRFMTGAILIAIGIGSIFAIDLVRYGYFILLAAFIAVSFGVTSGKWLSLSGAILLALFVGIQSPQLLFKGIFVLIGVTMIVYQGIILYRSGEWVV